LKLKFVKLAAVSAVIAAAAVALVSAAAVSAQPAASAVQQAKPKPKPKPAKKKPLKVTFNLAEPGYLTVAFIDGLMPKISSDGKGGLQGFEGWLLTKVAETYGLKIKPYPTTFSGGILAVQQGKADVGTSTYYTSDRAQVIYYTIPNILDLTGFVPTFRPRWRRF
jgi:ABC-type amino acid transport substrate-binding protein